MRVAAAAIAAFFALLAPSVALAGGSGSAGVHQDPGSPSQHQYVIPVAAARGETHGGKHSGGPQLFGSGVTPGSSSNSGSSSGSGSSGGSGSNAAKAKAKAKAHKAKTGTTGHNTPRYALASSSGRPPSGPSSSGGDGGSGWVPLAAGGALVLVLGCGGGFALRRRILRA
jgi:hypothetical protein